MTQPGNWSPEFNNFIKRCLTIDNKQRPTTKELLLDPFIDKHIVSKRGTQPTKTGKKPSKGAYGRAILRQLVQDAIADIEIFRQTQNEEDSSSDEGSPGKKGRGVGKEEVNIDEGLQTYVNVQETVKEEPKKEGSFVDIGNSNSLRNDMIGSVNNNVINPVSKAPNPSPATSNQKEPDFMQYIRNMNVN